MQWFYGLNEERRIKEKSKEYSFSCTHIEHIDGIASCPDACDVDIHLQENLQQEIAALWIDNVRHEDNLQEM